VMMRMLFEHDFEQYGPRFLCSALHLGQYLVLYVITILDQRNFPFHPLSFSPYKMTTK